MKVLFIDPACPRPYSGQSLSQPGIGGTEATVVRIAEAMPDSVVMQHCRTDSSGIYVRPDMGDHGADAIVVLRCPDTALSAKQRFPMRRVVLWLHDLAGKREALKAGALQTKGVDVVCVSDFHKGQLLEAIRQYAPELQQGPKIHVIYNPIADSLAPDSTPVNPNKLVFFSSPHKGLAHAVDTFHTLQQEWHPELELYVANPGYLPLPPMALPGVKVLDALPHAEVLQHVREAFCVWYPNTVFAETFGLVFAEANAVGTPVLTHGIGAAREVLQNHAQIVDCNDRVKLFDTFNHWWPGNRPVVGANPAFRLTEVVRKWQSLLT